jgi:hypothetical protein
MKSPLVIVLVAVVLVAVSTLAVMNNACKEQPTCVVRSDVQHAAPHKNWAQLRSGN